METGLDGPQVQAIRRMASKALHDPAQIRLVVAAAIGLAGLFLVCRPEAARLEAARTRLRKLEATAEDAEELRAVVKQSESYVGRLPKGEDPGNWQDYVSGHIEAAGVTLRKLEPRKTLSSGPFRVVVLEVTVDGLYPQLVDLLDRLDRGERVVRFDRLALERRSACLGLRFQVLGLVKLRA